MSLLLSSCCCSTGARCAVPFVGGYGCGAAINITQDWTGVTRRRYDSSYAVLQCGGTPDPCACDTYNSVCATDSQGNDYIEGSYCSGGTLPCSFANITPQNVCDGCWGNECAGVYYEPILPVGQNHNHTFKFCVDVRGEMNPVEITEFRRSGIWIPAEDIPYPGCPQPFGAGNANASYPRCGDVDNVNLFFQPTSKQYTGGSIDGGCCNNGVTCAGTNNTSVMSLVDNQGIWRVSWCRSTQGALLYPWRYECESEAPESCPLPIDNICKEDKSYCAMASATLQNMAEGWATTNTLVRQERLLAIGSLAESFEVITAGSGYQLDQDSTPIRLVWISGGTQPAELSEPWVVISSISPTGAVLSVSVPTNGGGMGTVVGARYSIPGGNGLAVIEVGDVNAWNAVANPWFRIHLRTIDDSLTQLQDPSTLTYTNYADPNYDFHLLRCANATNPEPAHYCVYKDCKALPWQTPCAPDGSQHLVTQPFWEWTNYYSDVVNDYGADLNPFGMTILDAYSRPVKTPWVTLALLRYWTWDDVALEMIKVEESYHCFGTQVSFANWWNTDIPTTNVLHTEYASCDYAGADRPAWLGLRASELMEIATDDLEPNDFPGQWKDTYTNTNSRYACNTLQGWKGDACCNAQGCTGIGTWIPDNSDEWRIQSMTNTTVILQARPRYWYGFATALSDTTRGRGLQII